MTVVTPTILKRNVWRVRSAKEVVPHPLTSKGLAVDTVYLHHSVTPDRPITQWLRSIERQHIDGDFFDFAYNMAVANAEPLIAEGRGENVQGGATGHPHDETSLSVVAIGDFDTGGKDTPTAQLRENLIVLLVDWMRRGKVSPQFKLRPHSDVRATLCCGKRLSVLIPGIEAEAKRRFTAPVVAPAPQPVEPPRFNIPANLTDADKLELVKLIVNS